MSKNISNNVPPVENNNTVWDRLMSFFYNKNVATLGIVFSSRPEIHGKTITSITFSQYVQKENPIIVAAGAIGKEIYLTEQMIEMNGIFAWYEKNGVPCAIEIEGDFKHEIISLVNHKDLTIHGFFADVLSRGMMFWSSGASIERLYFPSLEELENSRITEFKASISDDMNIPNSIAAHVYFEPKVGKLIDLIRDNRDSSGKADARTVHKLLRQRLSLNDDEAWSVFDYAAKFKLIEELAEIYVRFTGKQVPVIDKRYDLT